jgi:hypothetical protein
VTDEPTIREGSAADAVAVSAIYHAARTHSLAFLPVLHTRASEDDFFRRHLSEAKSWISVDAGGHPIGFLIHSGGFVHHLYVHPSGQGTASARRCWRWRRTRTPTG